MIAPPYQVLFSYHYFKTSQDLLKKCLAEGGDVFVDSGAFSAETKGVPINIDEYCQYLLDVKPTVYAGLDVIGDAKKTAENVTYMEQKYGLSPIPTFHIGSNPEDLRKLFKHPYIALGGLVFSSGIEKYLDEIWSMILMECPTLRVHGFGMTNIDLMERYPWYSVDSSSYKSGRRFGRINILWNGFDFKTFSEEEFAAHLLKQGWDIKDLPNKERWCLYDYHSVMSYRLYAEHLKVVNKIKSFDYLTAQRKMF